MPKNQFESAILYSSEAEEVYKALKKSGHTELATRIREKTRRSKRDRKFIENLGYLSEDEFDVDDCPVVSQCDEGAYVMVWRWVSNKSAGIEKEDESD